MLPFPSGSHRRVIARATPVFTPSPLVSPLTEHVAISSPTPCARVTRFLEADCE